MENEETRPELRKPNISATAQMPQQTPPVEKRRIIQTPVKTQKPSWTRRILDHLGGGSRQNIGQYILLDVMVPAAKNMISEATRIGVDMLLFGEARRPGTPPGPYQGNANYRPYNRYYGGAPQGQGPRSALQQQQMPQSSRAMHDFAEILLNTRSECDQVIEYLHSLCMAYGFCTVADMYEAVGYSAEFTDEKWGWNSMEGVVPRMVKGGWIMGLPRPVKVPQ